MFDGDELSLIEKHPKTIKRILMGMGVKNQKDLDYLVDEIKRLVQIQPPDVW